jgi:hypothetical protein
MRSLSLASLEGSEIYIVDGFYDNPSHVREIALSAEFTLTGPFPGYRTLPIWRLGLQDFDAAVESLRSEIAKIIRRNIVAWPTLFNNGAFQLAGESDLPMIHTDPCWVGVVYLSPEAPPQAGTSFYRHKTLRNCSRPADRRLQDVCQADLRDSDKWEEVLCVTNIFNRMVMFRGDLFHKAGDFFGKHKERKRLFQTFFFGTSDFGRDLLAPNPTGLYRRE